MAFNEWGFMKKQQTLKKSASCVGVGMHSGENITMNIHPAAENTGIMFVRKDVSGYDAKVKARYDNVTDTNLGTTISNDDGTIVSTIEHLMAALWGCEIDNALIELDGPEVPIMDGSSEPFVFLLECAGIDVQPAKRKIIEITKTVTFEEGDKIMSIAPSEEFGVNLEIDFSDKVIANQKAIFNSTDYSFKTDLCRARTFGFAHEAEMLQKMGLAKGASLDNAVIVKDGGVLNKDGLRYGDEFVRHKILDCIGDFYLAGSWIKGTFTGKKSGHRINNEVLRKLFSDPSAWQYA